MQPVDQATSDGGLADWPCHDPSDRPGDERVVVTGMGAVTALGTTVDETFAAMRAGQSGIDTLTRFDPSGLPCQIAGEVDADALCGPDASDETGGNGWRLLRTAAGEANVEAAVAGIEDRQRIAVILGGHGETPLLEDIRIAAKWCDEHGDTPLHALRGEPAYDPTQFTRRSPEMSATLLARSLDARGPALSIVSACAASTQAIGEGLRMLRAGEADVVITGGTEPLLRYSYFVGFALLGALTRRHPSPQAASRPFDRKRNGFVIAEGSGVLVLERLTDATARGRPALGEVLGYGDSADGFLITDPHPQGDGAVAAMQGALRSARVHPDLVDYVNAHGTSTPKNDPIETMAIKRVLGRRAHDVPVSSNKSMIGHTIGSAGAIETILTLRGMQASVVLPTINLDAPDRRCDLDYVPHTARTVAHRVALSNSFGFGGQNGCLCLGAAPA